MRHTILGLIFVISFAHADADIVPPEHLTAAEKQEFVDTFTAERARLDQAKATQEPVKPADSYAEMTGQKVDEPVEKADKPAPKKPVPQATWGADGKPVKMHIFKDSKGNVLLTNTVGENRKPVGDQFSEYNQEIETKPIYKKVRIPAKKVYRKGWCKIGEDFAPCYKYQKTVPAKNATVISGYKETPVK